MSAAAVVVAQDAPKRRNAIVFVADGLRHGSVNAIDTPALYRIRTEGVYFANSHAVFPTQTMPNAAAIATGHYPGDTGQFANQILIRHPLFMSGTLGQHPGTIVPDVEDPLVLADINRQFGGHYLREASLVAFARSYGYNTAVLGKTGPAASQDLTEVSALRGQMREPVTIILDGATGTPRAVPVSAATLALLKAAGLPPAPPPRHQSAGTNTVPGTRAANIDDQQWFADAATRAILPAFAKSAEPFVLVYWSGDPDYTQHAQGDSLNQLTPGINGATSKAAIQNADRNLKQILDYLDANPEVRGNTNLFVTSDHGFSTVSRRDVDASGRATRSYSASIRYRDAEGRQDVNDGFLPPGFLAIDLARELNLPLYDPEQQTVDDRGVRRYARVDPLLAQSTPDVRQHPTGGAALHRRHRQRRRTDRCEGHHRASVHLRDWQRSQSGSADREVSLRAGLHWRVVRQRSAWASARSAPHERRRPHGRRHDVEADDCCQFQELSTGSEKSAHERHHHRRSRDSTDRGITDRSRAPTRSTTWRPSAPISRRGSSATPR